MAYSWPDPEFIEMRIAAVVLACVLGSAAVAWAAEPARAIVEPAKPDAPPATPGTPPAKPGTPPAPGPDAAQGTAPAGQPATLMAPAQADAPRPRADSARRPEPARRVCFSAAETREKIAAHRLAEPIKALRVGRQQGEALRARLCSWKTDKFVYEVFVLRRDGRIVRVYMNAANGQAVGALSDSDLK